MLMITIMILIMIKIILRNRQMIIKNDYIRKLMTIFNNNSNNNNDNNK